MARVLEGRDGIKIGGYRFPDRKRPALCVQKGNRLTVYGYFRDDDSARLFRMTRREKQLEYALLLMVHQYCVRDGYLDNECMSAGEVAFGVLDIDHNTTEADVWARIEELERGGVDIDAPAASEEEPLTMDGRHLEGWGHVGRYTVRSYIDAPIRLWIDSYGTDKDRAGRGTASCNWLAYLRPPERRQNND